MVRDATRARLGLLSVLLTTAVVVGACAERAPVAEPETELTVTHTRSDEAAGDAGDSDGSNEPSTAFEPSSPDALLPGGWGPILAGMNEGHLADLGYRVTITHPARGDSLCSHGIVDVAGHTLYVEFLEDRLAGVSNTDFAGTPTALPTDKGIAYGSPISEVTARYPGATEVATRLGTVYVVTDPVDPGLAMSFAEDDGVVSTIRAGNSGYAKYFESCINVSG